jgi:hypothetical protein
MPADHSIRAIYAMNCSRSLKHWGLGFESHKRHACLCVLSCLQVTTS